MSRLTILTEEEQCKFDHPPILSPEARALCFMPSDEIQRKINQLRTPTNKVGFLLQYGYFKSCQRFFVNSRYYTEDIHFVYRILGVPIAKVDLKQYAKVTRANHQKIILDILNYTSFKKAQDYWISFELYNRVEQFTNPRELFFELLSMLYSRHVEIPSYHYLSELITHYYFSFENKLLNLIQENLTVEHEALLESLLTIQLDKYRGTLNQFKFINQSLKPKAINASINIFIQISDMFMALLPIIQTLNLSSQSCQYYATWVKKSKLSQLKQFPNINRKYLYLIAFIQHQYYLRQDTFVDILIKCVQSVKNLANRRFNKSERLSRNERRAAIKHVTESNKTYRELVDEVELTAQLSILI